MMFGTPIHLPIDLVLSSQNPEIETQMYGTVYSNWLTTKLETIHNLTRDKIQLSSKHMIKEYSKKVYQQLYEASDAVWYYSPKYGRHGKKLYRPWTGPYIINKRINDVIYKIRKNPKLPIAAY